MASNLSMKSVGAHLQNAVFTGVTTAVGKAACQLASSLFEGRTYTNPTNLPQFFALGVIYSLADAVTDYALGALKANNESKNEVSKLILLAKGAELVSKLPAVGFGIPFQTALLAYPANVIGRGLSDRFTKLYA